MSVWQIETTESYSGDDSHLSATFMIVHLEMLSGVHWRQKVVKGKDQSGGYIDHADLKRLWHWLEFWGINGEGILKGRKNNGVMNNGRRIAH